MCVAIVSWLAILGSWILLDSFNLSLVCSAILFFVSIAYAWRMDAKANPKKMDPLKCQSCGYDRSGLAPAAACPECNTAAMTGRK